VSQPSERYNLLIIRLGRLPSHPKCLCVLPLIISYNLNQRLRCIQDLAAWYENKEECGCILDFCKSSLIPRCDIFTTKLKLNNGYDNVKKAVRKSLDECSLVTSTCISYVDPSADHELEWKAGKPPVMHRKMGS
jgi:hypothetical protein